MKHHHVHDLDDTVVDDVRDTAWKIVFGGLYDDVHDLDDTVADDVHDLAQDS